MYSLSKVLPEDRFWLAGLLEGEGSFLRAPPSGPGRPIVIVEMCDEDVIARVATILGLSYQPKSVSIRLSRPAHWKTSYTTRVVGRGAVELMVDLYPLMGHRRQEQIVRAVATWSTHPAVRRLTREQGEQILAASRRGDTAAVIAEDFGISKASVYAIRQGRYFGPVDDALKHLHAAVAQLLDPLPEAG